MKKLLLILSTALLLSCNEASNENVDRSNIREIYDDEDIEYGLFEIKIDDSTTIFLYKDAQKITMIKK
jgi:hypothetical protein